MIADAPTASGASITASCSRPPDEPVSPGTGSGIALSAGLVVLVASAAAGRGTLMAESGTGSECTERQRQLHDPFRLATDRDHVALVHRAWPGENLAVEQRLVRRRRQRDQ